MIKSQNNFLRFFGNSFTIAISFFVLVVLVLVFPYQNSHDARAQGSLTDPVSTLRDIESRGLVPCGTLTTSSCKLCDIFQLAKNLTDFFIYAGLMITAGFIGYGGFLILTGSYSEEKTRHGKEVLTSAITGLLILLVAWLIVDTSIKVLKDVPVLGPGAGSGASEGLLFNQLGPWNDIQCQNPNFSSGGTNIDLNNLLPGP
ncbi:MAG: pilin [Patescibacteria group bacterium]